MVLGIGCDIIEIYRIKKAISTAHFLNKHFTAKEQELADKKGIQAIAGNFCAKEAFVKALGTGFGSITPIDIEVLRHKSGAPYINIYGNAEIISNELGIKNIMISISHSKEYAISYVVLTDD